MRSAASDLPLIEEAAREAGAIARAAFGGTFKRWEKSPDQPVTEIDLAVNALLEEKLRSARPDYGWLSEESPDNAERLSCKRTWIIDPIDGTRAFINGEAQFAISIGLVEDGLPVAGGVYNPMRDRLYLGAPGVGASLNGASITPSGRAELEGATLMAWKRVLERVKSAAEPGAQWPKVKLTMRSSIAYRLSLVAAGAADGALMPGYKHEWDVAAGAAILLAGGGKLTDPWGEDLRFNQAFPRHPGVIASGPNLHSALVAYTRYLPHPESPPASPSTSHTQDANP